MMMPANYSVIAENEMTYVSGGNIWDAFPAIMTNANWRTFGTNLIKIIGNSTMGAFIDTTVGTLFGGNASCDTFTGKFEDNYGADFSSWDAGFNTVMSWVGALGAIYTLGSNDAKTLHNDKVLTITGKVYA